MEAVIRDIQVGVQYHGGGTLKDEAMYVVGGSWNFMNGAAGILNIITITGWLGICIKKPLTLDGVRIKSAASELYSEQAPVSEPAFMKAIPYYAWSNRGLNQMKVWMLEC